MSEPEDIVAELRRFSAWGWEDMLTRAADEIERLRSALKPFADIACGIPDNWPGECHLRIDSEHIGNGETPFCREWLCYHGVCDCQDVCLPTIDEWRKAARAAGGGE